MNIIWFLAFLITGSIQNDVNNPLPSVMIEDLEGNKINANTLNNDGQPFVVVFWASWVSPSKRELDEIHEEYEDLVKETGVKIIAISVDDVRNKRNALSYLKRKDWTYDLYFNPNKDLAKAMDIQKPPHTLLYNGQGELVWSLDGYGSGDEEILFEEIRKIAK